MSGAPGDALAIWRPRRGTQVLVAAGAAGFVALGAWMATWPASETFDGLPVPLVGWAAILFFGACFVMIVAEIARGGDGVVATEEGITLGRAPGGGWGPLRWPEIAGFGTARLRGQRFLLIALADPHAIRARLGAWPQRFTGVRRRDCREALWVAAQRLGRPLDEVLRTLTALWEDRR